FWELVGGCSYLMIGFWHHRPASGAAAMKAFVVNRVGDVGFIVGLCLLIAHVGNATLPDLWLMLGNGPATGPISPVMLTLIGTLLFCGAIGKSAQFPLQTWLPDAMAGPTPVSALIHAATMVAAGVFLLARIFPILTADARLFVVIIGAITIALGSLCALAQRDIKRALAYSTIAQLGYMVLAIGVGSWVGALFHLVTHAFFKALLFLGAGNVIHAMDHDNRLERYGGLMKRLPVTGVTFALAGLAMSGAPYLSGLYSKELIIGNAAAWTQLATDQNRNALFQMALWVPVVAAYLTPLYMTRLWVLTFLGVPRDRSLFRHAGEAGTMSFPLVLLSGMTIVCGYSWFPVLPMIETAQRETQLYYTVPAEGEPISAAWPALFRTAEAAEATDAFDVVEPAAQTPAQQRVEAGLQRAHSLTGWSWLIGIVTGLLIYWRGFARTDALARFAPFRHLRYWLANGMFFDELYEFVFTGTVGLLTAAAASVDRHVIDPLINFFAAITARAGRSMARADDLAVDGVVRGVGAGVMRGGDVIRLSQPGRVRVYIACALSTVVLVLAAVLVVMRLR
ncbi:MAG TPA: NADH-quinone oxidoreductase subunit L, partial [Tepidisphaeraceae bacterium]